MSLAPSRALICSLLVVGCSAPSAPIADRPAPQAEAAPPATMESKAEASPESPPDLPPAEPPVPVVTAETRIGVEACDAYADRYRACITDQVPIDEKGRHTGVLVAQLGTWLAAAADPKLLPLLDGECAAAAEAARASTRILGCVWREGDTRAPERVRGGMVKPTVETVPRPLPHPLPRGGDLKDPFGEK